MQFPLTVLLLSAGALQTTLALPTNLTSVAAANETSSSSSDLDKRSNYPWIGSYGATNWNCKGKPVGKRPKIKDGSCIKFAPTSDNVGLFWGDWPYGFNALDIYTDSNCEHNAGKTIRRPGYYDETGPGSCMSVKKHGAQWGSVKQASQNSL